MRNHPQFRVAIVSSTPYAPPWSEGVRNLIRRISYDFVERGVGITIIGPKTPNSILQGDVGEQVINLPTVDQKKKWLRWPARIRLWLATSWAIHCMNPEPDIVLLVASVSSSLGLRTSLLKLVNHKPLVIYSTGLGRPRIAYNWGLRAERYLVGSDFLLRWFPDAGVIYPFLPVNVNLVASDLLKGSDDAFTILFLGSFEPERGVEYLLMAMALVKKRASKKVKIILAWNGIGAGNYENIQKLIDSLDIRSIVDLRGRVDINSLYHDADIVVIPRASQERMSFPVRFIEAVNMQKPIIVSQICGMEKLVDGCGLSVEPRNSDVLADAILELIENDRLRKEFSSNCVEIAKKFDSHLALNKLYTELRNVIENGSKGS